MMMINKVKKPVQPRVGLVYDTRMLKHFTPGKEYHHENPNRIKHIWERLESAGITQRCVVMTAKEAEDKYVALVHEQYHVQLIKNISSKEFDDSDREMIALNCDSIYLNKGSSEAAFVAVGAVMEVTEKVAKGELDSAVAIVRPPGHHATPDLAGGFCLFNNVAVAAKYLLDKRPGLGIRKILIVDWDVHHGNGTQKVFWDDNRVLVFSVHRYDHGKFYPSGKYGSHSMIGEGLGAGYTVNVPWEGAGVGDADYFAVWDHVLIPITKAFNPDIILISGGFDAAVGDPLGKCRVTPFGFSVMMKKLMDFAKGKIVMALEGGYNLESLADSVLACVKTLLNDKPGPHSQETPASESSWRVIKAVRRELSKYWPVLANELPMNVVHNSKKKMQILPTTTPVRSAPSCSAKKTSSSKPRVLTNSGASESPILSCRLQSQSEVQFTTDITTVSPAIKVCNNGTNLTPQAAALQRETNNSKFSQNHQKERVLLTSTEIKTPDDTLAKKLPEASSIDGTIGSKKRVIPELGEVKSPNNFSPLQLTTDTSTPTLAEEVSNSGITSTSRPVTLQGKTNISNSSGNVQKKRDLFTATENTLEDAPGNKRQKPSRIDGAKGVLERDVTPLGEFGRMLSTMESLMKWKPSMPWKVSTEGSKEIEESKCLDVSEFSVEDKIAYVEAMSPALPELYYSAALQSKFAHDLVQHHKQLAAKERLKREETEALCSVAEHDIEKLKERLVAAENTVKQQEAESQDLWQRNDNLEAAKFAAQTKASEAKQLALELKLKAAKLEEAKSAAEAEAAEAKQQAVDSERKAAKLEADKSAAEVEAVEAKQQAVESESKAAKLEAEKSVAEVEAAEAKQQAVELTVKAAKLEAEKSSAEAEAAEAKQQMVEAQWRAAKLEAEKSAAEAEAAEAKQQVVEAQWRAATAEKKVVDAEQLVSKERQQREALKKAFDESFKHLKECSTLLSQ